MIEVYYNVPIDPNRFEPSFGPNVQIIGSETFTDHRFALGKAIVVKEVMGLVFAVHELKRVEGGPVFVLSSTRASDQTIHDFGPIRSLYEGDKHYGESKLDSGWKRVDQDKECFYQPADLAVFSGDGLRVFMGTYYSEGALAQTNGIL